MFRPRSALAFLCLVPLLNACQDPPPCPDGMTKVSGLCTPATAEDASADGLDGGRADGNAGPTDSGVRPLLPDAATGRDAATADAGPSCDAGSDAEACRPACDPRPEICDGLDNDCDGVVDNGVTTKLYRDADRDGHGDAADLGEEVCEGDTREGKVTSNDDCNDACATCHPGNTRETLCDGQDDDCDNDIDDGLLERFILDCDGDGYQAQVPTVRENVCPTPALPSGCSGGRWLTELPSNGRHDCNDMNAARTPFRRESCDDVDNDCDAQVDEGAKTTYVLDCDGDGYVKAGAVEKEQCPHHVRPPPMDCTTSGTGVEYVPTWRAKPTLPALKDCADADAQAKPGSTFSSVATVPGRNDWDYNCDGVDTRVPTGRQCTAADRAACRAGGAGYTSCYHSNPAALPCGSTLLFEQCLACNIPERVCRPVSSGTSPLTCR